MKLFESWQALDRIVLTALLVYGFVILLLRVSGKRSTSKMNNFDWVVTIALGSIVAKTILDRAIVLTEGMAAIAALVVLQYAATKMAVRSRFVERLLLSHPTLLFYEGKFFERALREERVTKREILSGMRASGYDSPEEVAAVVLEPNAQLSVFGKEQAGLPAVLEDVSGVPER